jgi:hypothetical protein
MTFLPNTRRPFSMTGSSRLDGGLLQVDMYYPTKVGTAALEAALDAVIDVFPSGDLISSTSHKIWINYAERGPLQETADDISGFVRVSWRCHSDD